MTGYDTALAAWQAVLSDDTPWGAIDDDALLDALDARDRHFDAASRATAALQFDQLSPDERAHLESVLARVAATTVSLEQRVIGRRAAIGVALDAAGDTAAQAVRSPYARPLSAPRLDTRR